ncbi:MAG: sulfatase-like hydrolase/transferase [Planctomycetota bacterium]
MSAEARPGRVAGVVAVLVLGTVVLRLAACGPARGDDLTIVVISLDTTRPDHLSAYGYPRPTSPNLARLAAEGAVFSNARSVSSWTLPTHMSLFTGLPAAVHEVVVDFHVLDSARPTLGEIFQANDYRTFGVFSAPYVHGHYGFDRGMDFYERATQDPMIFDVPPDRMRAELGTREARSHTEVTSKRVVDRAITLLRTSRRERNLLFLHFFDPHYDYRPPQDLRRNFALPGYSGPVTGQAVTSVTRQPLGDLDRRQLLALYDAELAFVDQQIGRLLDELKASGRLDRTLIVVTGDHGEEFFERGRFGHRAGLMDEVLRIPLIVWAPGRVPAGLEIADDVALYDVLPTLLDYAGLSAPEALYGRSLRPLIDGQALRPRPVTAALSSFPPGAQTHYELHRAFILDGLKLVRRENVAWAPATERDLGGAVDESSLVVQVYDLLADPGETRNLWGSNDPRIQGLLEAADEEEDRQREAVRRFQRAGTPAASQLDLSLQEFMQGTGYFEGAPTPALPSR